MAKGNSRPKANKQLIKTVRHIYSIIPSTFQIDIRWIKAHVTKDLTAEDYWNTQVDKLAAVGANLTSIPPSVPAPMTITPSTVANPTQHVLLSLLTVNPTLPPAPTTSPRHSPPSTPVSTTLPTHLP